ncbi:MAG: thiol:disulfide interchange protein DsbA/DsbL [Betaproteobacteria bacterium]
MHRLQRGSVMLLALMLLFASAAGADLMEDVDYRVIPKQSLSATERIEVVYFFYYGCQWCYRFEPYINEWLKHKPVDVSFRRIPALRNTKWITLTRAYYAYDSLALLPRLHAKTFQAFHESDVDLTSESGLFDWVARQGVKRELFEDTFHSEEISTQMLQSRALTSAFQIDSTPSVAVDGRYISDSGMTGGAAQLMDAVDGLVRMARDERRRRK